MKSMTTNFNLTSPSSL